MPAAVTLWAASLVSVNQDTLEMDLPAQVNNIFACQNEQDQSNDRFCLRMYYEP